LAAWPVAAWIVAAYGGIATAGTMIHPSPNLLNPASNYQLHAYLDPTSPKLIDGPIKTSSIRDFFSIVLM